MVSEKRLERVRTVVRNRHHGLVVIIENIHDPHNAEAIFRSCDAFGVQNVHLVFGKEKPWNPRKIGKSSSSSAHKWLSFFGHASISECVATLKGEGYFIIGSVLSDDALNLYSHDFSKHKKVALIIGNEHSGMSIEAQKLCDVLVKIPMRGMLESLNVSVAAAIFLSELTRQRMASARNFTLTKNEQDTLERQLLLQSSKRKQHT
jgi:tRNA (guanosine-2'-O-)-methyltransferase